MKFKVVIHHPPTVDDEFVHALFGTDIEGLAEEIRRGEHDELMREVDGGVRQSVKVVE